MVDPQRPVVVPLDGSENAMHVLPMAALLCRVLDAPLSAVHVVDDSSAPADAFERSAAGFRSYVTELEARYDFSDREVTATVLQSDSPAPAILEFAQGAAAITLASHGRGGFRAMFMGSVADKIIRGSRVPVLVVPGDGVPPSVPRVVLIALDGSPESERSLALGRKVAAGAGARVLLTRSYHLPPAIGAEFAYSPEVVLDALADEVVTYLASVAREGEETVVMQGPAADAILEAATQHDVGLVVMTSSGKGIGARLAFGSTTDRVMHSLHRALLIVPQGDQPD
ncbi:MAG TPA: universal stress protein [Tepidiformaceae bacterium]|nr:universal stress protein [Tepidiformaceae bacterium]